MPSINAAFTGCIKFVECSFSRTNCFPFYCQFFPVHFPRHFSARMFLFYHRKRKPVFFLKIVTAHSLTNLTKQLCDAWAGFESGWVGLGRWTPPKLGGKVFVLSRRFLPSYFLMLSKGVFLVERLSKEGLMASDGGCNPLSWTAVGGVRTTPIPPLPQRFAPKVPEMTHWFDF